MSLTADDATANESYPDPSDPRNDLWGRTICEAASAILSDARGGWLHYQEVARRAFVRGYRSNRMRSTRQTINKSFFDTMRRQPEYERSGPLFRVIPPARTTGEE